MDNKRQSIKDANAQLKATIAEAKAAIETPDELVQRAQRIVKEIETRAKKMDIKTTMLESSKQAALALARSGQKAVDAAKYSAASAAALGELSPLQVRKIKAFCLEHGAAGEVYALPFRQILEHSSFREGCITLAAAFNQPFETIQNLAGWLTTTPIPTALYSGVPSGTLNGKRSKPKIVLV